MSAIGAVVVRIKEGASAESVKGLLARLQEKGMDPEYDPAKRIMWTKAVLTCGLPREDFACLESGNGVFREITEEVDLHIFYPEGLPA